MSIPTHMATQATKSIVLEVCHEYKIQPDEFFGNGRDRRLSNARRIAIMRLKQAGFSNAGVARLMRRSYSTIQYWLFPEYRARRTEYFRRLHASRNERAMLV